VIEAFLEHLADNRALFDRAQVTARTDGAVRPACFEMSGSSSARSPLDG
jgi:hypothetical protein